MLLPLFPERAITAPGATLHPRVAGGAGETDPLASGQRPRERVLPSAASDQQDIHESALRGKARLSHAIVAAIHGARSPERQWQAQADPHPPPDPLPSPFFFSPPSGFEGASDGLEEGVEPGDPEGADEPFDVYPLENQPPPLRWKAVREINFSTLPLHDSQEARGGSLNFWIFSNTFPQDVQRYS